jgi:hypothetical protein
MSMGSGAAEGLQQVLERLFLEAKFKQEQREHADRQGIAQEELGLRSRGLDIQQEGNQINADLRRDAQESTIQNRKDVDADRDAARELTAETRLQGQLNMMPKGTPIDNHDMLVGMAKRGYGGMLKPVPNEPRFEFGGTASGEARDAALTAREKAAEERERHNRETEQNAATRTGWGPPVIQIHTTDGNGNAVTKVMPKGEATGQECSAGPTTEERNRKTAGGRAAPVLSAISELSERINVNQGVAAKITGEVERKKAQANLNDDISEYEAVVSGFTPLLARAVGHVGILTEQDVQSVRQMLPSPGDSTKVRDRKIARINSLMGGSSGESETGVPPPKSGTAQDPAARAADLIRKHRGQ